MSAESQKGVQVGVPIDSDRQQLGSTGVNTHAPSLVRAEVFNITQEDYLQLRDTWRWWQAGDAMRGLTH